MTYTANDVQRGARFTAVAPVNTITPLRSWVSVVSVAADRVHYRWENDSTVRETPMERFLAIVNDPTIARLPGQAKFGDAAKLGEAYASLLKKRRQS